MESITTLHQLVRPELLKKQAAGLIRIVGEVRDEGLKKVTFVVVPPEPIEFEPVELRNFRERLSIYGLQTIEIDPDWVPSRTSTNLWLQEMTFGTYSYFSTRVSNVPAVDVCTYPDFDYGCVVLTYKQGVASGQIQSRPQLDSFAESITRARIAELKERPTLEVLLAA